MPLISVVSYNQPKSNHTASWSPAITVSNQSSGYSNPTSIFLNTNNTVYITYGWSGPIFNWLEGNTTLVQIIPSASHFFVADRDDLYSIPFGDSFVYRWNAGAPSKQRVAFVTSYCQDVFVDLNNTLYCALPYFNQVVSASLDDTVPTIRIAAGMLCNGTTSNTLSFPCGIFVSTNFTLFVADRYNHRIQRFNFGKTNATTVAGAGASGAITLSYPADIVLDGDGYLFIVDSGNHRIIGSGPDGFRCVAGCSAGTGTASNQLRSPLSMSFDSYGNIWVADSENNRVQKFVVSPNSTSKYLCMRFV